MGRMPIYSAGSPRQANLYKYFKGLETSVGVLRLGKEKKKGAEVQASLNFRHRYRSSRLPSTYVDELKLLF